MQTKGGRDKRQKVTLQQTSCQKLEVRRQLEDPFKDLINYLFGGERDGRERENTGRERDGEG